MNKHSEKITTAQLAAIVTSTILGVAILAIPRFTVKGAGLGAPFASFVGSLIAFIGLLAVCFLGKRFSNRTVIGYNEVILGKWLGRFVSLLIILFFMILMGLETRQYAEVIVGSLLPNTPAVVSIFLMIFLCTTVSFQSVSTFGYIHFFYMPLIILPLVVVLLPAFNEIKFYHLTPFLGNNPTFFEFMKGSLVVTQCVLNFFVIAMLIPFMKNPKKCVKGGIWGFWIGCFFVMAIVTMTLAVFGENEVKQMYWPTLVLGRMVKVPGEILSRIDILLVISWIYGVFTTLLSYYYVTVRGIGELFHIQNYRLISLVGFPLVFAVAILPKDIYQMYQYILVVTNFGVFLTIVYPVFLLIVAKIRKLGGTST